MDTTKDIQKTNYTEYYQKTHQQASDTDYFAQRGIEKETIDKFQLGYDPAWTHPNGGNEPETPRIIIPTSEHDYTARDTRDNLTGKDAERSKMKVGHVRCCNDKVLPTAENSIVVVEGEIDALSVIQQGYEAIGLGSTTSVTHFLNRVKENKPKHTLIISLDNDDAGRKATAELCKGLEDLQVSYVVHQVASQYKDPNEALQENREQLKEQLDIAMKLALAKEEEKKEAYKKTAAKFELEGLKQHILQGKMFTPIPTGFPTLDSALDGGLNAGLCVVGAISSLGKTTFVTQMMDQMAQQGNDVLYFSLEMPTYQIILKSLSRQTQEIIFSDEKLDSCYIKTTKGISQIERYVNYDEKQKEVIEKAYRRYGEYAEHIYIHACEGPTGTDQIREAVQKHMDITGTAPIVMVDYLQIIAPSNVRASDKQNTDTVISDLVNISKNFNTPVIAISSFNRSSYKDAVGMEAFKGSGTIEYSSDVLLGLQLKGAGTKDFNALEEKKKEVRDVELVILKNRTSAAGATLNFKYYTKFNSFRNE